MFFTLLDVEVSSAAAVFASWPASVPFRAASLSLRSQTAPTRSSPYATGVSDRVDSQWHRLGKELMASCKPYEQPPQNRSQWIKLLRAMHVLDLGDTTLCIASFMTLKEISKCEEALFLGAQQAGFAWHAATMQQVLRRQAVWGPSGQSVVQQLLAGPMKGKALLRELRLLRKAIFPPKSWPEVQEKSYCSARVMPCNEESPSTPPEANGVVEGGRGCRFTYIYTHT